MKRFSSIALIFVLPAMLIACAKSSDENKSSSTPNGAIYNQYQQFGFSAYPTNAGYSGYNGAYGGYGTSAGFCNCGQNAVPVYNPSFGLGCASGAQFSQVVGIMGFTQLTMGANGIPTAYPQYSNIPNQGGSCQTGAGISCMTNGQGTPCQAGLSCYAPYGSPMGVCVQQQGQYW